MKQNLSYCEDVLAYRADGESNDAATGGRSFWDSLLSNLGGIFTGIGNMAHGFNYKHTITEERRTINLNNGTTIAAIIGATVVVVVLLVLLLRK